MKKLISLCFLIFTLLNPSLNADIPPAVRQILIESHEPTTVALSGNWIAIGQSTANIESTANAGQVLLHDAVTGKRLRTFTSPSPTVNENFGTAIAFTADSIYIGAPGISTVFIFSLKTGAPTGTLTNASPSFGSSLAVEGHYLIVGAPSDNFSRGAIYAYNLISNAAPTQMLATDRAADDRLGASVAISGGLVAAGANGDDTNAGSAYLFDLFSGTQISKMIATDRAANHAYGTSIALRGSQAFVGAPASQFGRGAVYQVDAPNGLETRSYTDPNGALNDLFGQSLQVSGSLLIVGAPAAASFNQGYVCFFDTHTGTYRGVLERTNVPGVSETGSSIAYDRGRLAVLTPLPSAGDAFVAIYNGISSPVSGRFEISQGYPTTSTGITQGAPLFAVLSSSGNAIGTAKISLDPKLGRGTSATGLFADSPFSLADATGPAPGISPTARVTAFPFLLANQNDNLFSTYLLSGPGINADNNLILFNSLGLNFRTGSSTDLVGGARISRVHQLRQSSNTPDKHWAMLFSLKKETGIVAAQNDSGLRIAKPDNVGLYSVREADPAPVVFGEDPVGAVTYGEFSKRLAMHPDAAFHAPLVGAAAGTGQGLFRRTIAGAHERIARQGNAAESIPGSVFNTFLGETVSTNGWTIFRATVKDGGTTSSNNEGLWRKFPAQPRILVARKGDPILGIPEATWNRFLGYWAIGNQILVHARMSGPGITTKNDEALLLLQENDIWLTLAREGYSAPGCPDAPLSSFQKIEVDTTSGRYLFATALGSTGSQNQAVFTGHTLLGSPINTSGQRLPHLLIRKGTLHQAPFGPALGQVKSLRLTGPAIDATGAGGTGLSRSINASGALFLDIDYGKNIRHLVKLQAP
jgi:hypothetical protein